MNDSLARRPVEHLAGRAVGTELEVLRRRIVRPVQDRVLDRVRLHPFLSSTGSLGHPAHGQDHFQHRERHRSTTPHAHRKRKDFVPDRMDSRHAARQPRVEFADPRTA